MWQIPSSRVIKWKLHHNLNLNFLRKGENNLIRLNKVYYSYCTQMMLDNETINHIFITNSKYLLYIYYVPEAISHR